MKPTDLTGLILNPPKARAGLVWGTVTQADPLEVQLAADAAPIQPTAVATSGPYMVGQRILCCWQGPTLTAINTPSPPIGALIAVGKRTTDKTGSNAETAYLELQADLIAGHHYEIRAEYITWRNQLANGYGMFFLRAGPLPVSTTTPYQAYCTTTTSIVSYGRQDPVSLVADINPTETEPWGALLTFRTINQGMTMTTYSGRLGIYDMGPAVPDTGIHH